MANPLRCFDQRVSIFAPHGLGSLVFTKLIVCVAALIPFVPASEADQGHDRFKIFVEESGVYSVTYQQLKRAGLQEPWVAPERIGVSNKGEPVEAWVEDGGDGQFGKGDRIVFVGRRLAGEYSAIDEYSRFNCYRLDLDVQNPLRGSDEAAPGNLDLSSPEFHELVVKRHFEDDTLMVRYAERPGEPQERWYWWRAAVTDKKPFRLPLTLDSLSRKTFEEASPTPGPESSVKVRLGLRGWSRAGRTTGMAEHQISLSINGEFHTLVEWNGNDPHIAEVPVHTSQLESGRMDLELRVPRRNVPESDDLFVDVSLVNWIEVEYPRSIELSEGQSVFTITGDPGGSTLNLRLAGEQPGWLYGDSGRRYPLDPGLNTFSVEGDPGGSFFAVVGAEARVTRVEADTPSALKTSGRQADYLLITHSTLKPSIAPLAEFHRSRGLTVATIDVIDIYDEFNHGIQHPRAIKDFISWAYYEWQEPRPRFVLLAGDASWDYKNTKANDKNYADWTFQSREASRFLKNTSTPYTEKVAPNVRNLVPTWGYQTSQGQAASDNWLVSVDGEDIFPDLAVGRIPVVEPEDMTAVVEKTIAYATNQIGAEWQRRLLFITNENRGFQRASDATAEQFSGLGFLPEKVYPLAEEKANEHHTKKIVEAFNEGLLLVQFLGHGGRYIWRTGPPDYRKNHDLFTPDHLDELEKTDKLPVVLSLTCYSAPFDHPTADSIGEKLLRLDDRGAVAIFAASWRNSPSSVMGKVVMEELTAPGATIGEAIMHAKRKLRSPILVETYNLLGDPAIALNHPHRDEVPQSAEPSLAQGEAGAASPDPAR